MVFEGLNHAGVTDAISALNDNAIGIDPSKMALLKNYYLTSVKKRKKKPS
jgi:deoxyxylulose-5-phosphate synthase